MIPQINLKRQYEKISSEIDQAILEVVESQAFILGPWVKELEEKVAAYVGVPYAVGVASGTDALLLSLEAMGLGPGDEVITTPFTFVATAETIALTGATPVFVDIDPQTFNIDPEQVKKAINKKTKGIMPVHLYGLSAQMDELMKIASDRNLFLIEDAAQAFGGMWKEKRLGSFGSAGCYSFFPSKNLGGFGDGGMVVTSDQKLAEKVRILRQHGGRDKYDVSVLGHNSRLDSLQAAVLLIKFKYIDEWNSLRRKVADQYYNGLGDVKECSLPYEPPGAYHVYNLYTIKTADRDRLKEFLREKGISANIYYPRPLHEQDLFKKIAGIHGNLKATDEVAGQVLSLPLDPMLSEEEVDEVVKAIREFFDAL